MPIQSGYAWLDKAKLSLFHLFIVVLPNRISDNANIGCLIALGPEDKLEHCNNLAPKFVHWRIKFYTNVDDS